MEFDSLVALSARFMEGAGVGSMMLGALWAVALLLWKRGGLTHSETYRRFRLNLGRAILLGLEFLVAADIIRTVSREPTLLDVSVLGLIVLVRTFLSFTLTVELEGRWPWQRVESSSEALSGSRPPSASPRAPREPTGEEPSVRH
ncbi:DUF1622 domain-containing protein [Pyxidicoccus parkwayensis]|jgi:uncharacterized membrane protein|uniref:DUF1622 domain-containing protein n=1 Tax=Pyxidicoccus parkwayensis TaxID=2813578 RepID=A0ABX7NZ15_9BACT|nr:DUF1622 domain-containing protein [Pyxidicoccus parkwaysis]QSQ22690.1 DUF1622 domain-containing protein [Pyxidicoccus parkwaysis]